MCHLCINLVYGRVLQEQWIWPIHDVLFHKLTREVSKRSSAVWETYLACERTVSRIHTLVYQKFNVPIVHHTHNSSLASNLRLRLVLWELVSRGNAYPMMPHGRPGRGSKTCNQAYCACTHLEYNVWMTAGWHTSWSVVAERSNLPDSSSGVSSRMWVRIPAVTLVSLSKTLNHNCFSPPRG